MKANRLIHWKSIAIIALAAAFASDSQAQTNTNTPLPVVSIRATDGTALEGTSTGAFTLLRFGPTNNAVTVDLDISGTASNGVDYVTISNQVTIPAGSLALDIAVTPIVDTARRGNKTVTLSVLTNADYQVYHHHASVEIIDNTFDLPPPSVTLTSPTNGSLFIGPASITITADVTDSDAQVLSVRFFANDDFLGSSTNNPATLTWTNAHSGHYALFARAVDSAGKSAISAPVDITVSNIVPVVSITSPTNGSIFTAGAAVTVQATATDAGSPIKNVTFFANDRMIGTSTNSPYSVTWTNAPMGFFFLEAVATDNNGARGHSAPVTIKVGLSTNIMGGTFRR